MRPLLGKLGDVLTDDELSPVGIGADGERHDVVGDRRYRPTDDLGIVAAHRDELTVELAAAYFEFHRPNATPKPLTHRYPDTEAVA